MATDSERLIAVYDADIAPYEKAMKRMEQVNRESLAKQIESTAMLSDSIDNLAAKTEEVGIISNAAVPKQRALIAANDNMATSAAVGAAKIGLFAASLGLFPGRIGKMIRVIGAFRLAMIPAVAAAAALPAAALKGIPIFAEWERQMLTLTQIIRATGGAAGQSAQDIENMATRISRATLATDDAVRQAAAQLLTFKAIGADAFERTLVAAQDLSAAGFGSLSGSSVQLGKALEDPIKGLSALRRVGVSFTAQQRTMITRFVEMGQVARAQGVILAAVEGQVGGAGAAAAGGLTGAFHQLTQSMENWFELLGSRAATLLNIKNLLLGLAGSINAVNASMDAVSSGPGASARQRLARLQGMTAGGVTGTFRIPGGDETTARARDDEITSLQNLVNEFDKFDRVLVKIKSERAATATDKAELQRFENETDALMQKNAALERGTLAEAQFQAIKRAGVPLDSERADQIRVLVKANFDLAGSQKAATTASGEASSDAEDFAEQVQDVVDALNFEADQLWRTSEAQELYNNLKSAGVPLESEFGAQVAAATKNLQQQRQQLETVRFFGDLASDSLMDGFRDLTAVIDTGNKALDRLIGNLIEAAAQALFLGKGPLATLFGTIGGGLFGGFRAHGGPVSAGKAYVVGERGPELFIPPNRGQIVAGGGAATPSQGVTVSQTFVLDGAFTSKDAMSAIRNSAAQTKAEIIKSLPTVNAKYRTFGRA